MTDKLTVAAVLKPQGIRGEIKVMPYTDSAEDLKEFSSFQIDGLEYSDLNVRTGGGFAYATLKGEADRNAAELLRGKNLEVDGAAAHEPPKGRYYIADLLGLEVCTEKGDILGKVTSVTPARTDIYTIERNGKEVSFAAADGVISEVDTAGGKIVVNYKRFKEVSV